MTHLFEPTRVLCKEIKYIPVINRETSEREWQRLPRCRQLFQIIVECDGDAHRLKMIVGRTYTKFVWHHPDRMEHPTLEIGMAKGGRRYADTRRTITDTLAPKRRVPGEKVEFSNRSDFIDHLTRILGNQLVAAVMELFKQRMCWMSW